MNIKNCTIKSDFEDAVGSGINDACNYVIDNCYLISKANAPFRCHCITNGIDNASITIKDSVLLNKNNPQNSVIDCNNDSKTVKNPINVIVIRSHVKRIELEDNYIMSDLSYGNIDTY